MADHDPQDETVLRNQIDVVAAIFDLEPAAPTDLSGFGWAPGNYQCVRCEDCGCVFEGAKRSFRCRSCAEKLAASRSSDAQSGVAQQPAAPISAAQVTQQIVDVVNAWQRERGETSILKRPDPTLAGYAAVGKIGRIVAGALEALTAENARLTSELGRANDTIQTLTACCRQQYSLGHEAAAKETAR